MIRPLGSDARTAPSRRAPPIHDELDDCGGGGDGDQLGGVELVSELTREPFGVSELVDAAREAGSVQFERHVSAGAPVGSTVLEGSQTAQLLGLLVVRPELVPADRPVAHVSGAEGDILRPGLAVNADVPYVRRPSQLTMSRRRETGVCLTLVVAVIELLSGGRRTESSAFQQHNPMSRRTERQSGRQPGGPSAHDADVLMLMHRRLES